MGRRWVPGLPNLAKVVRTVDSSTAMINYLRTLPADEVPPDSLQYVLDQGQCPPVGACL